VLTQAGGRVDLVFKNKALKVAPARFLKDYIFKLFFLPVLTVVSNYWMLWKNWNFCGLVKAFGQDLYTKFP
tara:strand:- start:53718 stop:53930 length:213 start_codon:yes stop_codon:yes gene_type:complete